MRGTLAVGVLLAAGFAGNAQPRPPRTAARPGLSAKELQDIRDEVIGTRAVVRHLMRAEPLPPDEVAYVEEAVNSADGRVPPAVAARVDAGKVRRWMGRDEVRKWSAAERRYQSALRAGPPRDGSPSGAPGLTPKELQDLRDEVIGMRAVARHLMRVEGFKAGETAYVEEYVNRAGVVPAAVAGKADGGKLRKWLDRAEGRAWVAAETTYQASLRPGRSGLAGGKLSSWSDGRGMAVEVLAVRLEPFRTADGRDTQVVCVDWKNAGERPVRAVFATITVYDAAGNTVYSVPDYCIYAESNDRPGVAAGQTYTGPPDDGRKHKPGYILPPAASGDTASRAVVEITRASGVGY